MSRLLYGNSDFFSLNPSGVPVVGQTLVTGTVIGMSGTGSPEGVVTAAPGSTWLQTDATNDVKGWIRWVKATGTGNTGWVAGPEADTGWRNVSASVTGGYTTPSALVRRVGAVVQIRFNSGTTPTLTNGAWNKVLDVPVGFRPTVNVDPLTWNANFTSDLRRGYVGTDGGVNLMGAGATVAATSLHVTFTTTDPWPTSLPGSAA